MDKLHIMLGAGAYVPDRAHKADAGLDLRSPAYVDIGPYSSAVIDTGVHVGIPEGYAGILISKSGLNVKHGITSTGLIDAGYSGSIVVRLDNHSSEAYHVHAGDKISQLVIVPIETPDVELVASLEDTERGANGFGSTGR